MELICLNMQMGGNGCADFVPFVTGVLREVDDIGFFLIIYGWSLDPVTSLVTHHQSSQNVWARINLSRRCVRFHSLQVKYMIFLNGHIRRRNMISVACLSPGAISSQFVS